MHEETQSWTRFIEVIPSARLLFLQQAFSSFRSTASLTPSSAHLASALLRPVDFHDARTVVELGFGTGVVTREILRRLHPDARLYALDVNENFVSHVRRNCLDGRLTALHARAEDLLSILALHKVRTVHAIVSSLGLALMEPRQRTHIVGQAWECLAFGGVMTQFQYAKNLRFFLKTSRFRAQGFKEERLLKSFFGEVTATRVLRNLPPALVYVCRK